ncbi:MAG: hypothetical protein HY537_06875 [Deltaproteobacteria bacterium]|nr:hypothetical protein [Deltaproteobacteria bacterium]
MTKLRLLAIFCLAIATMCASATVIFHLIRIQKKPEPPEAVLLKRKLSSVAPVFTYPFELRNLSLPFTNRTSSRMAYAQFTIVLDCPTEEAKHYMELNRAKVLDAIFEVGMNFFVEDFDTPEGYKKFKESLSQSLSAIFKAASPRRIDIQDWVIN